jgi:flagellar basal body-associated protein FliL
MTVFILAFAGAFLGSLVGAVMLNMLKKVEAKAEPGTTTKKVLKAVTDPGEEKVLDKKTYADWLYHKKEGSQ